MQPRGKALRSSPFSLLGKDVVKDSLEAIWDAITDLVKFGRDIDIRFGFCGLTIIDRNLKVFFKQDFVRNIQDKHFENKMKKSMRSTSSHWRTSHLKEWGRSTLGTLIKRPNSPVVKTLEEKTRALRIMSMDLSSAGVMKRIQASRS